MKSLFKLIILVFVLVFIGCSEDNTQDLPVVEERKEAAIEELKDLLTRQRDGWVVNYQPNSTDGIYYMVLKFAEDGHVNIQSDVSADDGAYYDQTIGYRIDVGHQLELVFETYGVFHYLFEQQSALSGAEFEFEFEGEKGNNLLFLSKSDIGTPSEFTLVPAVNTSSDAFSREIAKNLEAYSALTPVTHGFGLNRTFPIIQMAMEDQNVSVFFAIDLFSRQISIQSVAEGLTFDEVAANDNIVEVNSTSAYELTNETLSLLSPVSFAIGGNSYVFNSIALNALSMEGNPLCPSSTDNTPVYTGTFPGKGNISLYKSLFDNTGTGFTVNPNGSYSVNILFVFNNNLESLFEEGGIIQERFPNAVNLTFHYGFNSNILPAYAVGFTLENEDGSQDLFLREFDAATTEGNRISVNLNDNYYFSKTPEADDQPDLEEITNLIFEGGILYAAESAVPNLTLFHLFNPCNEYGLFLVKP